MEREAKMRGCGAAVRMVLGIVVGVCLVGCGAPWTSTPAAPAGQSGRIGTAPAAPIPGTGVGAAYITSAAWADGPWPFVATQGELNCIFGGEITFTTNVGANDPFGASDFGAAWSLTNGDHNAGMPLTDVVRIDPATGQPVNLDRVIAYGRSLCR